MTKDEVITEIQRGLGFRSNLATTIAAQLDATQRQLEMGKTLPWFLITYDALLPYTANADGTIDLPTDFLRMHDEHDFYYVEEDTNTVRVVTPRKNYTEARTTYGDTEDASEATRPTVIVLRGRTDALLYPVPTEDFDLYLTYYHSEPLPSTLAGGETNEWLTIVPELIIGEAGLRSAALARDKDAMTIFSGRRDAGQRALMGEIVEQEIAGRPLLMARNA